MRAKIDSSVSVAITDRKKGCINWSGDFCLEDGVDVTMNIVNKTEKSIKDINYQIKYFDKEHYGHLFNLLPPHKSISQTGTYKYNQYDEDDKLFLYSDINNMHIIIDNVVFENGDTLKTDDYPPMPKQPITTKNISTLKL